MQGGGGEGGEGRGSRQDGLKQRECLGRGGRAGGQWVVAVVVAVD